MNCIVENLAKTLSEWQRLGSKERDKIVAESFLGIKDKNIPMFSSNLANENDTVKLINKLDLLEIPFVVNNLPRSTLSIVTVGEVALPPMPVHKAIAFIAYMVATGIIEPKNNVLKFNNAN